jgi:segregation and condensation protein B
MQKQTGAETKKILEALDNLEKRLEKSALILIKNEEKYLLTVDSYNSKIIKKIKGHEEYGELTKSVLETLSVVLYKSPVSRFDIDNIRGVNSSHALRNLMVRGLIEIKKDGLQTLYIPTVDTFSHLGIASKKELPKLKEVTEKINAIEKEIEQAEKTVFEK